jgi:hypothetical protein
LRTSRSLDRAADPKQHPERQPVFYVEVIRDPGRRDAWSLSRDEGDFVVDGNAVVEAAQRSNDTVS